MWKVVEDGRCVDRERGELGLVEALFARPTTFRRPAIARLELPRCGPLPVQVDGLERDVVKEAVPIFGMQPVELFAHGVKAFG